MATRPNILYVLVDNLGFGELGCYGGGVLRGAATARLDAFSAQGMKLLNFAPEAQCTPSRSALMTGRYAIRSGNHTVPPAGIPGGLVAWEKTIADVLSADGYATAIYGKWHIGEQPGRYPTDHGFDEWYGIERSYDECLWVNDPWYNAERDGMSHVVEGAKERGVRNVTQLTLEVRRDIDLEYLSRAKAFMKSSVASHTPFFVYFNHSMMHLPTIPRSEFAGKTGNDDFADCLFEMDADFGQLLDYLDELAVADNTIVVFSGDNGAEECEPWRGHSGFFDGSYFTAMEGSLRTPCIVRYPGHVPAGKQSNEIVHITDWFPTLLLWAGSGVPSDRVIDGVDQRAFLEARQEESNRRGFPFWLGTVLHGVKWGNFKVKLKLQRSLTDPALDLPTPHLVNLLVDPSERKPLNYPHLHTWVLGHAVRMVLEFKESLKRESMIPAFAPLDFVPKSADVGLVEDAELGSHQ
jgi:arylsulfatase A-like enzyme